ncbi:ATP-binding protein [Pseudanabaena sp. FACHB-1998]|uniref:ATP-binding protein n=1 Tax=Pseudanabaena sp. FACHB-1998 TaxID=2692858 RepID=UPI0016806522|nr:ATP-binding protein [Pseudanabaena sp. FACHB-1998]MBD2178997.1 ATP-binding protein [Pseudanabaena sp. FACHB-1998]
MPVIESLVACNPSYSICLNKEEYYYIDLAAIRGEDIVKKLRRTIALSSNKPTYQLISGHIGSGKTTELFKLKASLEQQGFAVIYCAADEYLQINDVGLTELWLMILSIILQQVEKKGESLSLAYLPNAIAEIEQWLRMSPPIGISTYLPRLQRILQALQANEQQRRQLRHHLESRLKNSLLAAGEEVTAVEVDRLKQMGKKGLVILVDNLDRLNLEQVDNLFGEGGKYLRQFQCHAIYTLPLLAMPDESESNYFQQRFKGTAPILLPNLTIGDRHGVVNSESLNLLRQLVMARLLPSTAKEKLLDRVHEIFDQLATLDRLIMASQGHLPYLLSLLYGCLQMQDPPIHLEVLNQVLETDREMRLSTLNKRDRQMIEQCVAGNDALKVDRADAINLCRRLLLFEHRDSQGYWYSSPLQNP